MKTDTKTDMNKLEGTFHCYPNKFKKVKHNFRTIPMVTPNF